MDFQQILDNAVRAERAKTLANSDQLTLGELIAKIEPIAQKQQQRIADGKSEAEVYFDFEYLKPTGTNSWRGSYSELAIGFDTGGEAPTVTTFFKMLQDAVGKTYYGYKGGEFTMNRQTPIWVANWGNAGNTAVIGIMDLEYRVIIQTGYREY